MILRRLRTVLILVLLVFLVSSVQKKKCFKTETDPIELDYVLTGGAKFETSFSREDLSSDESLNLYILSSPIPSDVEGVFRRFRLRQRLIMNIHYSNFQI